MISQCLKFCSGIHLVLFSAAIACVMPVESLAILMDQFTETFEFIFSAVPIKNYYLLHNAAAEAHAYQLLVVFFITAIPSYMIGYPFSLRLLTKRLH